jgi:oxygen-independent coproporphyrinogen-3 oxidase
MSTAPQFDPEILERYDRPGPRYTSYPTAPQFTAAVGEAQLREQARRSDEKAVPRPISLYLHIPYCFSPCFYCGCNRLITRDEDKGEIYRRHLQCEIALAATLFDRNRKVVQLHLGGGTPNFLPPTQIKELVGTVRSHFTFSEDVARDFSIELDPRFLRPGGIGDLARRDWETAIEGGRLPVWRGLELDFDDEVRADVIQRLMCLGKVDMAAVERRYGIDFASYFSEALERLHPLVADGLATVVGDFAWKELRRDYAFTESRSQPPWSTTIRRMTL